MTPADFRSLVHMVMDRYPESVFPEPDSTTRTPDRFSAAGARLACRSILKELDVLEAPPVERDLWDLSKCPVCGGPADNGHDRELPPNVYACTKCSAKLGEGAALCNE